MESVTGGEECLEEKKGDTEQEPAKTPSKKKKKKKKKNKNSTVEASGSAELLTEESVSINVEETQQTDCKTIAEEKPEIDAQHGDEKNSFEDEGSLLRNKDELKQHDLVGDGDVAEEKKPPNSSSEGKSSKKRKKKNSTLDNVVAEEKVIELVTPPGEVDKSDFTNEKPDDNETSFETPDLVPQKPCNKEKSNSPVINRKKKKKKKTGGFLLSDLDLTEPQNDSNKEKEDGKVVAEKQGKSLCDNTVIPAERESDLANFTDDKSLLMLETREKFSLKSINSPGVPSEESGSDIAVDASGSHEALSENGETPLLELFDTYQDSPPLPEEYECSQSSAEPRITSGGAPLCILNRTPACCAPLPPPMPQPDHTVLIRVSKNGDFAKPPKPSYSTYRDRWDRDHVRMPCSIENLYPLQNSDKKVQKRWELVESTLLGPIRSSHELQDAILKYNARYSSRWNFEALHTYFNEVLTVDERNDFFVNTLPAMVRLALQLPEICTQAIPLMKQHKNHCITMSQHQAACLLANAFFCTFPRRNEYSPFPDINFNRLFQGGKGGTSTVKSEKLKAVLHYFKCVTESTPSGVLTFQRQSIPTDKFPCWDKCPSQFTRLHVSTTGTIEDDGSGFLQVDFANKYIGGGVIGEGCVQEEIRFLVYPEMILSRLICERMDTNESIIITGAQRYSNYTGYAHTFKWAGDHDDQTPRDSWGRRHCQVVAIDAQVFKKNKKKQFRSGFLKRELDKAYCGFFCHAENKFLPAIATGNWGCGAFGGDSRLKGIIQMMAASATNRDLVYFTFGDSDLAEELLEVHSFIREKGMTVGEMWGVLCKYGKEISAASSVHIKLYSYLYQLYHRYDCDTDTEPDVPESASIPSDTYQSDTPQGIKPPGHLLDKLEYAENQS